MKSIYFLLVSIFLFNNCTAQQNEEISIMYKATTRGSFIELSISNSKLTYADTEKTEKKDLSKKELKKIQTIIEMIDLQSINSIRPPSTKSHFDGAMSTSITIQHNGKEYDSSRFDHGNPPEELKPLINYIFNLIYIDSN